MHHPPQQSHFAARPADIHNDDRKPAALPFSLGQEQRRGKPKVDNESMGNADMPSMNRMLGNLHQERLERYRLQQQQRQGR